MILSFKTKINGKPTYFVEKIWAGLEEYCIDPFDFEARRTGKYEFKDNIDRNPKIHTIREDRKNRWKEGKNIDFFINSRTENMFRFAPKIAVISTQELKINWFSDKRDLAPCKAGGIYNYVEVIIDGKRLEIKDVEQLAINDGFDSVEDFFDFFNQSFKGKIIHWTKFKYYGNN